MSAPNTEKRTYIAQRRVLEAFGRRGTDAFLAIVVDAQSLALQHRLRVRTMRGEEHDLAIADPEAVAAALERDDLTRVGPHPLLLVNRRYRLIAVAIGLAAPPNRIEVLANVVRITEWGAAEIPGADGQPSWLLFQISTDDPAVTTAPPREPGSEPERGSGESARP